jgi:hypothetical protein
MTAHLLANSNTMVRLRYQHRGHVRIDLIDGCANDNDRVHIVRLTMPIQMFVTLLQLLSTIVDDQHLFDRVRDQLVSGDYHHILLKIRVYSPASIDYAWSVCVTITTIHTNRRNTGRVLFQGRTNVGHCSA